MQIPAGEIYVISNGWHTEIGVPASALNGPLAIVRSRFPGASYFAFGWGERTFYMNPDPTWAEALRALFPARAVLLVLALPTVPSQAFVKGIQVMAVPVSEAGIAALMHYVWRSFARLGGGPERLAAGPYPDSAFYAAMGTYDGRHTCNTWTADALREAGLAVKTAGVVFAGQVTRQVRALQDERSAEQSLR